MVSLNGTRRVLLSDKAGTKKHERIGLKSEYNLRAALAWQAAFSRSQGWHQSGLEKRGRGGKKNL